MQIVLYIFFSAFLIFDECWMVSMQMVVIWTISIQKLKCWW